MALNRIYKVVWSKTKGCYVVVSELAKRVGRNKAKAIVISSAAMAMAVSPVMTSTVSADLNKPGSGGGNSVAFGEQSNATGQNAVALGAGTKAQHNNTVAIGKGAQSTGDSAIALGFESTSTSDQSVAVGLFTKASNKQAVAVGSKSQATGDSSIAIGKEANASNESSVALGSSTKSTNKYTTAVGGTAFANQEGATALGYGARATDKNTIAIGYLAKAEKAGVLALGSEAQAQGDDTIAIGNSTAAKKAGDIIIGKDAKSRDQGAGRSVAIGFKASAGSNRSNYEKDDASTGQRGDDGSVAIGTNAYTGLNRTNAAVNSSVAIGAGAGVGYRSVGADGKPLGVGTDADDNDKVLVKAFGGTTSTLGNYNNVGAASNPGFFSFQGVDINEGTALGRNTRAIGDQSVAIGAQSVAGMGSIVIGGNDIQAYDQKKYFKAANPTSGPANTVNDYDAPTTPGTGKDGQPITISKKYEELVGAGLDRSWRASYGQDGSTVIGMQAHSTTPLGVAIGTNSIVRKGAFGATAIGSGASVLANAEAAVAIGMGAEAQGNYAVAAGTAARAKASAVAAGYQSKAEESAVAVGDRSNATNSSVAVGQGAQATKEADIAVGQGAKASGNQGAIAMGLGTQAQGDSSIMIGGSEITKVADQRVSYQKEKIGTDGKAVIKTEKKTEMIGGVPTDRTVRSVVMENTSGTIQQAYGELTNGGILNTATLDYSSAANRNGHGSISMGVHSLSTGDLGTAIGTGARVTKLGGVALGTGAISELQNGVAIGTGSRADSRSIGTRQTDISYDEEGHIVPFDSKKVAYTFYWAGGSNTSEGDVVSFGSPGAERQLKNVAAGRIADDSTDAINGSQLNSVTKRMSNGWSVEAEKDKTSSGVLKLNGALATKGTEVHSANGKTTTRENPGTATGNVDKIRLNDEVKIRVGDNLVLHQEDASRPVYEDPDNPDRQTGTRVTSKFTYSLNPELTGLKSAQFKNDAGDTTDINGAGVTVTPVTAGKQPVSLTTAGLNNGGNAISNVAGNLPSTKNNDATTGASNATTSQAAPTLGNAANQVNPTNAATVSDVLNAGWNLQGNNKAVDFVKPYDTVNFVNGDGTTATVESADGKTSTVKYSVNLGDGLKKDDTTNKITVSAADKSLTVGADGVKVNPGDKSLKTTDAGLTVNTADKSLEVTDAGLKVKAGDKTLTTDEKGLKVNTGEIESVTTGANPGTVKVKDGDTGKVATVDSVVNAVNSAAFTLKASANGGTRNASSGVTTDGESIKAGSTIEMIAGKNLDVKHDASGKITFATVENPSFNTMQVGGDQGPKLSKTNDGDLKVSGSNGTDPVKVTNVKSGLDTYGGNVAGTTDKNTGLVDLSKPTAGEPKVSDNTAATVGDIRNMGWIVSSNKTTGADGAVTATEYSGTVKNANEVRFVGTGSAIVSGKTDGNVRTITVKVDDQTSSNNAVTPVVYTDKDGNRVYPTGETDKDGNQIFNTKPDGKGNAVTGPVKTTVNGPKGTSAPTTLSNVEGNLVGAKTGTDAPTTSATAPTLGTGTDQVNKNNAATVGDVLNAGWNLQNNDAAKDFVKPYDTVNFVDGEGTTAVVETTTDQATSKIKYNVNTGKGLEKTTDNKITVKPGDKSLEVTDAGVAVKKADQSLEVTDDGLKVKTDNKTITTGKDGLTVNTGTVNAVEQGDKKGTVEVPTADAGKIATVDTVAKAVNNAAFTLKASANGGTRNAGSGVTADGESIKAGSTIEMIAGKNLDVKHDASGKITFATIESPSFNTIQVGGDQGPKLSKTDDGNIKVSDKDGTNPVNITNVKSNLPDTQNSDTTNTATNPSNATTSKAAPNTTNKTGDSYINPNNAATVSDVLNAGWNLQGNGSAVDFVKPYDTVNFVNGVNTTAVVSTVDGKTSNVTYNVTGLPITYTDKDGNLVSKIGDEFYKVNDKGQPLDAKGNPSTKVNKDGKPVDDAGNVIDPINTTNNPVKTSLVNPAPEANKTGTTSPTTLDNVTSKLENYKADPVNGKEPAKNSLRDLTNTNVTDNTVATVGDIRNMGWIVSSDKTTGANGEYSAAVKNANEVRFIGEGSAIVSGKTEGNVRTITVKVDNQTGINKTVTPVNYTKADGTKVYPQEVDNGDGTKTVKFFENPDGTGKEIPSTEVITSVNGPKGTTTPATLSNVKSNLPDTKNSDTTNTATDPSNATKSQAAPNTTNKDGDKYINPNNAATVSDVLNVGWNLQGNGTEVDFVKPYDTVNFVNGLNTTAVVSTVDGKTSNVTYNVTGLPVTYTTEDGTPVTKIGDKYYKVNDKGQPVDGNGAPVTKFNKDGKPLDANGQEVPDVNITDKPLKTSLVNPAPETNKTGTISPTSLSNVKNNIPTVNDEDKTAHKADGTAIDGKNNTEAPITAGDAANLLKPIVNGAPNPNFVGNNAATVSDVLNAGWNLQNNGTAKDFVKPYDTVNFINGLNTTAVVTTSDDGTTSNVTYNVTGLPVTYTTEDGTPVTKIGDKYYKVNDKGQPVDGTGAPVTKFNKDGKPLDANGQEVPDVNITDKPLKTSLVNPAPETNKTGTTSPTSLSNVKNNIPTVNDEDKTAHKADGTAIDGKNNTEAPITAGDAANLLKPIVNGAPNPNFVGNNAATVSDVLNAGWNLQNNGTAKDFVKPYDTVNFVNGANTTAVVTTNTAGTASDVTFNVTGLPVTYTTEDGAPVSKVGDKYYKVNDQGQPISDAGKPAVGTNNDGKLVDENNNVIEPIDTTKPLKTALVNPTPAGDKPNTTAATQLGNVTSGLDKYGDQVNNADVPGTTDKNRGLVDLSKPANGDAPKVSDNTAATVGDLRNMGWIVSSNKTTGENGAVTTDEYSATVKNANEVKFVGEGTAVVSGKTDDKGVRTITVKVDDQTSTNNAVTPVVYTDKDGKQVYPTGKIDKDGNQIFNTKPDGKGEDVTGPVKTTINGPKGTTSPASLSNVKNNIPAVNDADKKVTNPDGTNKQDAGNVANINKAPLTAEEAADLLKPTTKDGKSNPNFVGNNAATVSDVLNAGWNLQNNGTAKDFVKPYDTVNFVNGGNTTAVVTTNAEGTVSDVTFNVTGLPVTNTITENGKEVPVVKVGNTFYPAKPDGTPDIQKGQDGNPTNGYVQADNGKVYPRDAVTITKNQDGTTTVTPNTDATPKTVNTNLVNPNVANTTDKPGNNVSTPNQLGNVANGAKTFEPVDGKVLANDGKWYPADKVSDKGTPEAGAKAVENPLAPKNATGEPLVQAKDGKWYKPSDLQPNGTPTPTAQPQDNVINNKAGLVDFSNSNPNNAATIGDLQNMGWVVSAQGNSYSDQVRNTNEVKFVGEGTASVTGKTDDKGVRTITVKVDDQVSTNNSVTPVIYTDKAGNTVYPIKDDKGNVTYHTTPDGKGENDKVVPNGDVNTSINGPKDDQGNTRPASLSNVKNNIPAVNDADKKVTNPDGTDKPDTGNVANINKAPLTAEEAADLLKPTTKDGKPNLNFVGNNAATVSDVLNAGWNLQNNGTAKDFVKSFDTVNFVNGGNTTAVVTTNAEGTASDVTFNVTGLPIATTIATPNGPVQLTKVGDNYYPVNADGTPNIQKDGDNNPTNGYVKADNGNYYPAGDVTFGKDPVTNVTTVTPKDGKQPVTFGNSLTNPNVVNTTDAPNKAVAAPTTLNNVKGNLPTVNDADKTAHDVDGAPIADKNNTAAPITAKDAANLLNPYKVDKDGNYLDANGNITTDPAQRVANPNFAGNNAATVSDVLNAGWNLTGNGAAVDLVKPYDTVNFRNGGNTTVSVTTDDNLTSHVQVNVTGLPVSNTITDPTTGKQVPVVKVGDSFYPVNPDGTPKIERGQDGNPTNGYVRANDGKLYPREDVNVTPAADPAQPPTITPKDGKTPTTVNTNLVNPNVDNTTDNPGNNVSTPNQLGNVANGAKTFDSVAADGTKLVQVGDKFYPEDKVKNGVLKPDATEADAKDPVKLANDGKWYKASDVKPNGAPKTAQENNGTEPKPVANPLAPKNVDGDVLEKGNDGKWYKANELTNGKPNNGAIVQQPVAKPANSEKSGLIDFTNSNPNNAATIGDLQNMGWVVSAEGNSYSDQVRNANEVKFVGEGTAIVSGKTDDKGVRTITVKVDDQTSTNNSVTPVNYTKADGTKVYPKAVRDPKTGKEEIKFFENPDGSGAEVPKGDVVTSINGPEGTTSPTTLKNVKNNIPNVNDGSKTITNPDGTEKTGDVENINKAPLTAEEAAALANPKTKDGQANPKYIGNNAATVSDVLNAGWNLQNNGAARDFVKPFDTVNFVNGVNTTAVVTTSEDGTTSNVTYNVTGLPVTYTTADGTPVSKIGDDYYTVNDKGQPIDANGKPSTKVNKDGKPVDENGNVIKPIDTTANPLTSSLVNPNVKNTDAEPNKKTTDPTQLGNVTSGLQKYGDTVDGKEVPGSTKANNGLVDLSTPTDGSKPKVSDNTAATVGDLRNMGWIVSSDKTTGETDKAYTDTVKNANEVKFVGEGTAIVSGKTDDKGVRTITVKVDDQTSTNNSVTPVNYTKADGTKVYPKAVRDPKTGKEEIKFFENPDGSGAEVPKGDVVTSINGPEGTTSPTTLKNVKNNIPNVNDGSKTITNPDGTEKTGDVENINKAPLTAEEAAALANPKTKDGQANPKYIGNNAATVSDVLNAGWNLQNNGESRDFVKPYDTVNFVNGLGTTAVVTTREDNTASDVTFNVKAANGSVTVDENGVKVTTGEMKPAVGTDNKETGAIATPADPATAKQLKETLAAAEKDLSAAREALKEAEKALAADPKDPALQQAVADKKADVAAKQTPVDAAQKAHDEAGLNKVATVQNVAEAINNAGFNLKTSADGGEKLTGTKDDGELIKPSNTVEMVAGNNLTVKQDANGKITYATKDNVTFTNVDTGTLNVGSPNTYTDGKGNTYTKVGDKYYKPADVVNGAPKPGATPVDVTTTPVTPVSPVTMKAEAAKPATNNNTDAQPSSALNITSKDGKPTQITGVGSTLNTKTVDTTPAGTAPGATPNTTPVNLVDLEGTADAPVNKNAAATVGDLQNMGWVVSAKDGNGYKDVVKNANVVDFKGGNGIEITGKTLTDGTREITVGIKEGEVTNKVTITHTDGSKTDAIKIGDNYYKVGKDGKPEGYEKGKDGKPAGTPLTVDPKNDKVTNTGAGFVTGNTVANAIQESGWNVGIGSTDKDYSKDAKVYDKVNPNDDVKFANGANTNVSMVTVDAINEDGTKKATTYVKVDVNRDLKIDSVTTGGTATDKNGNNLVKVGDKYYKEGDVTVVTNPDGSTTVTPKKDAKPVSPADVIPAKDGAMIVKNADGKDVVSATVGKDGSGVFGVNGKDGKDGVSITAKDGEGAIGVNGKDGATTTIKGDTITLTDKDKNTNTSTPTTNVLKDTNGNTNTSTAANTELKDKAGNTNTSTSTTVTLADKDKNTNTSTAAGTTYKDKDDNKTVVGPKEINISDKSGENTASLTNKDLLLNAKDPNTGVDKTSHVSGDKIAFTTTDEMEKVVDKDGKPVIDPATGKQKEVVKMEKVFDKDGKPVIDPATGKQKEVVKNPGNSTEYTNEGLKVIPNSTVARDVNGNPTFLDKNGKPVMKDTDGKYKYVGQDGKPGEKYTDAVGSLKPNVVDNTRVISFGMDKPVLDKNGKPVTGPDGNPIMTEGISAGMQQMHNLAPGTKDTDAVNVSQLRGTTININNRMNRMGAQAAALAGLQSIQYDPLEPTQISAGLGYYKGSSALALGINHYKNESTMFHMGASLNGHGDETMMNASVTWKFGARADETAVKDTFRQGPISASYTLQDKVSALEAQNKIQKDQLNELRATNAAQKAENEAQREELALMKAQIAELFKRMNG